MNTSSNYVWYTKDETFFSYKSRGPNDMLPNSPFLGSYQVMGARGGWLCIPLTATTLAPSMWIRALQLVFLDVQRHITLSLNLDSSQNGNVFTTIITFPRRDFKYLIPTTITFVRYLIFTQTHNQPPPYPNIKK